jgi:hypothetical protein
MPTQEDIDPIQDSKHAREAIPARIPTLADLHRRWMHARLAYEQADRAAIAAHEVADKARREMESAANPLAERLLKDTTAGLASRQRRRRVAVAGEALEVYELGVDYPGEFGIDVIPLDLVTLE